MKNRVLLTIIAVGCCVFAAAFCEGKSTAEKPGTALKPVAAEKPAAAEKPMVSAHTSGEISREAVVKVQFTEDIAAPEQVNTPLAQDGILTFQPEIKGAALWIDRKTIEFRPEQKLPAGTQYKAVLDLAKILKTGDKFEFSFVVMQQAFEVTIDGLQAAVQNDTKTLRLTGKLVTRDVEDFTAIMSLLKAELDGKGVNLQWSHSEDRKEHSFSVENITRQDKPSELVIQWDGAAIGTDQKGRKTIHVPAIHPFEVLEAKAQDGDEQCIEIRFSDPLQKDQNLDGLLRLDPAQNIRFAIDRNILRVYSSSRWTENVAVTLDAGIRNIMDIRLGAEKQLSVTFKETPPQVRFVGKGVIIPTTYGLTIPIETVNLQSIIVEAMQIYDKTLPQFLQVNNLEGSDELKRVGSVIWKKTVSLDFKPENRNQWMRFGLDLSPLIQNNPSGFFRIRLYFNRSHIVYKCDPGTEWEEEIESTEETEQETSYWDNYEEGYYTLYEQRENPCHRGYYRVFDDHDIIVSRNVLISDIGLISKIGADEKVFIAATDIRSAAPLKDVELTLMDYQQQVLSIGKTDEQGIAILKTSRSQSETWGRRPFLVVAKKGNQAGYLKLDDGSALPVGHFDVSGQTVKKGIKGFIYGERGVWRPGDPIYLTFILMDATDRLPKDHPVLFELLNPKGQIIERLTEKNSINGFYCFKTQTTQDAPTGNWTARVRVGGTTFEKMLKIETIMPNRLKIKLNFGKEAESLASGKINAELSALWLHGAIAKKLKADMEVSFAGRQTGFTGYPEYIFDDPVRRYEPETQSIFEGQLNDKGKVKVTADIEAKNVSPGMLTANFKTRVFEPGGAFSVDRFSKPYHPYDHYVGVDLPKGDKARGMLLTDTVHPARIAIVDKNGKPVNKAEVEASIYKIKWRWWWEKGSEDIDYLGTSSFTPIKTDKVKIENGQGQWDFEIKYPEWGRYLVRVCDPDGGHCTGKIVYIDWPGWAGRSSKDSPGGASVLSFSAEKEEYTVGEDVVLNIPAGKKGTALVSIENGSRILKTEWIDAGNNEGSIRYAFSAIPEMAPGIYIHVMFLQPHLEAGNDLPIRLYGVIPLKIVDPKTRLTPKITAPDQFTPEQRAEIAVSEANGEPMTYTLAIVDEGLLDLTRFKTPNPWEHFYQREALGVKTWDIFDMVAGAYGGTLERLLAIGGDSDGIRQGAKKAKRFPPMVKFLGPFILEKNQTNTHQIDIPQYVGSVRIMAVCGMKGAFGFTEKAVFVKKPLMILATLPRVLGPDEEMEMPVSVFALDEKVKNVSLKIKTQGGISLAAKESSEKSIAFSEPGEDLINFRLKAGAIIGIAKVSVEASAKDPSVEGTISAAQDIEIDIRMPVFPVVDVVEGTANAGETWNQTVKFPGITGTNKATLEISRIPPLNLGKRLNYLIRYPHGCIEQTTSAVFPQLYLDKLLTLSPAQISDIQKNIKAGIAKIQTFQTTDGGFGYWQSGPADTWATNYAGHFLIEAQNAGYTVSEGVINAWKEYQRKNARSWTLENERSDLIQAYRLYTLALCNSAETGAMNRLREDPQIPAAVRWRLAAAYQLAGQPEAAQSLTQDSDISISEYQELSNTYGSALRDKAMVLEALCLMNRMNETKALIKEISEQLGGEKCLSTQETAYALIAVARHAGIAGSKGNMKFSYNWNGTENTAASDSPITQIPLEISGDSGNIALSNQGETMLYLRLIMEGIPPVGNEKSAENGMKIDIVYMDAKGENKIKPESLDQGTDFTAVVTITNTGHQGIYREIALSHLFPSGWEIHNTDLGLYTSSGSEATVRYDFNYQDIRDDRIYTYFDIGQGESKSFTALLNAAYLGKFYLPMVSAEAMYDSTINARIPGQWIKVVRAGN